MVRCYHRSDRLLNAVFMALRGWFDAVWAGVLSHEQAARSGVAYYDRTSMYVTESYNRRGLWPWEQAAIDAHFGGVRRIVVTSAGGGRQVLALDKAGYEVVGLEPHQDLVRFGNRLIATDGLSVEIRPSHRDRWSTDAGDTAGVIVVGVATCLSPAATAEWCSFGRPRNGYQRKLRCSSPSPARTRTCGSGSSRESRIRCDGCCAATRWRLVTHWSGVWFTSSSEPRWRRRCPRSALSSSTSAPKGTGGRLGGALPVGPSNERSERDTGIRTSAEAA